MAMPVQFMSASLSQAPRPAGDESEAVRRVVSTADPATARRADLATKGSVALAAVLDFVGATPAGAHALVETLGVGGRAVGAGPEQLRLGAFPTHARKAQAGIALSQVGATARTDWLPGHAFSAGAARAPGAGRRGRAARCARCQGCDAFSARAGEAEHAVGAVLAGFAASCPWRAHAATPLGSFAVATLTLQVRETGGAVVERTLRRLASQQPGIVAGAIRGLWIRETDRLGRSDEGRASLGLQLRAAAL